MPDTIPEDRFYGVSMGAIPLAAAITAIQQAYVRSTPGRVQYMNTRQTRYNHSRARLRRSNYGYSRRNYSTARRKYYRRPSFRYSGGRRSYRRYY